MCSMGSMWAQQSYSAVLHLHLWWYYWWYFFIYLEKWLTIEVNRFTSIHLKIHSNHKIVWKFSPERRRYSLQCPSHYFWRHYPLSLFCLACEVFCSRFFENWSSSDKESRLNIRDHVSFCCLFLTAQNSSKGDIVTQSVWPKKPTYLHNYLPTLKTSPQGKRNQHHFFSLFLTSLNFITW